MLRLVFIFAAIGISLFLTSCYTISKKECLAGDWKGIGFTDGFNGHSPEARFEGHIKSCKRVKVVPDPAVWKKGYKAGLLQYCTPEQGLWRGKWGYTYVGVCPRETEPGFLRAHHIGYEWYYRKSQVERYENDRKSMEQEIEDLSEKLEDAPEAERGDIESDISLLKLKIDGVDIELNFARNQFDIADQNLRQFESEL